MVLETVCFLGSIFVVLFLGLQCGYGLAKGETAGNHYARLEERLQDAQRTAEAFRVDALFAQREAEHWQAEAYSLRVQVRQLHERLACIHSLATDPDRASAVEPTVATTSSDAPAEDDEES